MNPEELLRYEGPSNYVSDGQLCRRGETREFKFVGFCKQKGPRSEREKSDRAFPSIYDVLRSLEFLRFYFALPETCSVISCGFEFATATTLDRSFIYLGGRHVERSDYGVGSFDIDDERVREGVIGYSWDVLFVVFERHITELEAGEVDPCDSPGEGA